MVDTCHYKFVKNHRVNPKVNYGLWVILMCQCNFVHLEKNVMLWSRILVGGEVMHVDGQGVYGNSLRLLNREKMLEYRTKV